MHYNTAQYITILCTILYSSIVMYCAVRQFRMRSTLQHRMEMQIGNLFYFFYIFSGWQKSIRETKYKVVGDRAFHEKCFVCNMCVRSFVSDQCIPINGKYFCLKCHYRQRTCPKWVHQPSLFFLYFAFLYFFISFISLILLLSLKKNTYMFFGSKKS